jgi:hypothetical protein
MPCLERQYQWKERKCRENMEESEYGGNIIYTCI